RDERAVEIGADELNFAGHREGQLASPDAQVQTEVAMKSAYELAMERLEKSAPTVALTNAQKAEIAEIDSSYKARIAEKELFLKGQIRDAQTSGKFDEIENLQKQLSIEVRRLQEDCEEKKNKLRATFAG
ncbi:MAG: hypothetical protein ACR2MW_06800, partial [Chthoniobacterales bacterium]